MPRYFFDMKDGSDIKDLEGREIDGGLDMLRQEAIEDARALISQAALSGTDISDRRFEISDDLGNVLLVVRFSEVLTPEQKPQDGAEARSH